MRDTEAEKLVEIIGTAGDLQRGLELYQRLQLNGFS